MNRRAFVAQRAAHLGLVLLPLSLVTFLLLALSPGNIVSALPGDNASEQETARLEAPLGLGAWLDQ